MAAGTRAYMNLGVNAYAHELMRAHTRVCEQPTKRNRTTRQARMNQQPTRAHTRPHPRQAPARPPPHLSAGRNVGEDPRGRRHRQKGEGQRHPGTPGSQGYHGSGTMTDSAQKQDWPRTKGAEAKRAPHHAEVHSTAETAGRAPDGNQEANQDAAQGDFHRPPSRTGGSDNASQAPEPSVGRAISRRGHARLETSQQNMRGSRRRPA